MKAHHAIPIVVLVLAVLAVPAGVEAQAAMSGSLHDLRTLGGASTTTEICAFCHTPHQATAAGGQAPLWNHTLSTVTAYGVYSSGSFQGAATIADVGVGTPENTSLLCMSCHDGTVGPTEVYKQPGVGTIDTTVAALTGNANIGTSLADDHPVNFDYDAALATSDGELVTPASAFEVVTGVPLFNTTVQCASCHDAHNTQTKFLVVSNANSDLCITCHIK